MENNEPEKFNPHHHPHGGIWEMLSAFRAFNEKVLEPYAQKQGLTFLQSRVLMGIRHGKFTTVGGMADHAALFQGNASTLCKRLEQQGFLRRERNAADERVVNLFLTDKGLEATESIARYMEKLDLYIEANAKEDVLALRDGAKAFLKIVDLLTESKVE